MKEILTRTTVIVLCWLLAIVILPRPVSAEFAGGAGTIEDPYQIRDWRQLLLVGADQLSLGKHYVLVDDIDLDPNVPGREVYSRAPIGSITRPTGLPNSGYEDTAFTGTLDGNGHAIRNLRVESRCGYGVGLFGMLTNSARISNLRIEGFRIVVEDSSYVGLLAGINSGWVNGCRAEGQIVCTGTSCQVGGLVGDNSGHLAVVRACMVSCGVDGRSLIVGKSGYFGGVAGTNGGIISTCVSRGQIAGARLIGGLIGNNGGLVMDSFATGGVRGGAAVGGLAGWTNGSIRCCYSTGRVELDPSYVGAPTSMEYSALGGLVGVSQGPVLASFWDMTTSGTEASSGGTGLTSEQMIDMSVYVAAGWDFIAESQNGTSDSWFQQEGHEYPQLVLLSGSSRGKTLSGRGTKEDPYRIASAQDLGLINHCDLTATFQLTGDIDLSDCQWLSSPIVVFDGTLEGSGHVVADYHMKGGLIGGLFTLLGRNARVIRIGVDGFHIEGSGGGLADTNFGGIQQCFAKGIIAGNGTSGGLVGLNYGEIRDCYSQGDVSGDMTVGGAVGITSNGYGGGRCLNLYSTASVTGEGKDVGGGRVYKRIGGLIGDCGVDKGLVEGSFYLFQPDVGEVGGGEPLTDDEMKQPASFIGWDFENTWCIEAGKGYPILRWQRAH